MSRLVLKLPGSYKISFLLSSTWNISKNIKDFEIFFKNSDLVLSALLKLFWKHHLEVLAFLMAFFLDSPPQDSIKSDIFDRLSIQRKAYVFRVNSYFKSPVARKACHENNFPSITCVYEMRHIFEVFQNQQYKSFKPEIIFLKGSEDLHVQCRFIFK